MSAQIFAAWQRMHKWLLAQGILNGDPAAAEPLCKGGWVLNAQCRHCRQELENRVRAGAASIIVGALQFLPPGPWVFNFNGTGGNDKGRARILDLTRFSFLEGLGPLLTIIRFPATPFSGREYSGFVLRGGKTGRPLALVECPVTDNALYAFRADDQRWLDTAQRTKLDVITGPYPDFICRFYHEGDWQARVRDFVSRS